MSDIDEMINDLILEKFKESRTYELMNVGYFEEISITECTHGWNCYCYSEYTRDDQFEFTAVIQVGTRRPITFIWGQYYDLPGLIQELADRSDKYCIHEEDD